MVSYYYIILIIISFKLSMKTLNTGCINLNMNLTIFTLTDLITYDLND